ncbi:MAG: hypothetical protein A2136_09500 [Chloroflexi bacterium RBG_16_54_11]|nr:MAG: hypothetical protein A2136_09500 [Chloroflexi bacterium RBG_16_54_11]
MSSTSLLLVLGTLALLVVDLLIALVEGVTLTLLGWNPFRASMTVSAIMNLASGVVNGILLALLQRTPLLWIPISFLFSLIIDGFILSFFKRGDLRKNLFSVFLANLVSLGLLILPAYYFGSRP